MTSRTIYNVNNNFAIYCKLLYYRIMKYGRTNGGRKERAALKSQKRGKL